MHVGPRHEIVTAAFMGWGDLTNGELLRTAETQGMEVFVTGDRTLAYEQNLTRRRLVTAAANVLPRFRNSWPIANRPQDVNLCPGPDMS